MRAESGLISSAPIGKKASLDKILAITTANYTTYRVACKLQLNFKNKKQRVPFDDKFFTVTLKRVAYVRDKNTKYKIVRLPTACI